MFYYNLTEFAMRHIVTLLFFAFIVPFLLPTTLPAQDDADV